MTTKMTTMMTTIVTTMATTTMTTMIRSHIWRKLSARPKAAGQVPREGAFAVHGAVALARGAGGALCA